LTAETVEWAFVSLQASNWHPLTWLSHALDSQMFGLDAGKHHETNLLLHVINVVLLFLVLWRASDYIGRSAMVAALFALHPMNVESVAWIAERKNLLSMMFFLLTLGAYRWYARQPAWTRYLTVFALFALGLMAKPQVITLPFVLLLWDYWPLERIAPRSSLLESADISAERETTNREQRSGEQRIAKGEARLAGKEGTTKGETRSLRWLLLEKVPLLELSIASAVITVIAQYQAGSMTGAHWQPFPARLGNAIVAYARYLGKAIWPSHLAIMYPHPGSTLKLWQVFGALVLLIAITAAVIAERHRRRYLLVGWLWFLGTLVPMIGLVQVGVQAMADRYAYLPFLGLFIMVCWGVAEVAEQRHIALAWQAGVSVIILLALAVTARRQLDLWGDNNLLWWEVVNRETQALQANPNNVAAQDVLAHAYLKLGQVEDAVPHFRAAVAIDPLDPDGNLNLGAYEQRRNNLPAAIEQYKKVLAMTADHPKQNAAIRAQAFSNLAFVYRDLKDYAQARANFQNAVGADPDDARSWIGIGLMAQKSGDLTAAIQAYNHSLELTPSDFGYLLLAQALDQAGRHDEAEAARRRAAALSQNLEQATKMADDAVGR
jgi:tetratricopeptide (TPR) repeat protein